MHIIIYEILVAVGKSIGDRIAKMFKRRKNLNPKNKYNDQY